MPRAFPEVNHAAINIGAAITTMLRGVSTQTSVAALLQALSFEINEKATPQERRRAVAEVRDSLTWDRVITKPDVLPRRHRR